MQNSTKNAIGGALTIGIVAVLVLGSIGAIMAHVSIHEGNVGVVTDKGAATGNTLDAGWHFINPVTQGVNKIETRPRTVTYNDDGAVYIISEDGQDVWADVTIRYSVESDRAVTFFEEYKDHDQALERVIEPTVRSELRDQGSAIGVRTLITREGRIELEDSLGDALQENFNGTGLTLEAVQLRNTEPNEEFSSELEQIEVENARAEQRLISANATAEAEIIEAEGDAQAAEIRDAELTDEVLMDKYIDSVNNADTVILSTDSNGTPVILDQGEGTGLDSGVSGDDLDDSGNGTSSD